MHACVQTQDHYIIPVLRHPDPASTWLVPLQAVLAPEGAVDCAFVYDVQAKQTLYSTAACSSDKQTFPLSSASHSTLETVHERTAECSKFADATRVLAGSDDARVLFGASSAVLSAIPDTNLILVVIGNALLVEDASTTTTTDASVEVAHEELSTIPVAGVERISPSLRTTIQLVWQRIKVSLPGRPIALTGLQEQQHEEMADPIEQLQAFLDLIGGPFVEGCDTPKPPTMPRDISRASHASPRRLRSVSQSER
jgi:hypothetical protein